VSALNNKEFVQFDELEGELDQIMTEMAHKFAKVDPAIEVGEVRVEMAEEFSKPYADRFITHLNELETEHDETLIREEFAAIIDEFDTVDRAVYAKTDEQEPSQGIAVLVAEHKTKVMQMLQEKDEGYDA
jgi:hypothetical protein